MACCCGNGKAAKRAARSGENYTYIHDPENYTYIHDPDGNMIELVYRPLGLEDKAWNKAALADKTKGIALATNGECI